jgi:hypothetical protein
MTLWMSAWVAMMDEQQTDPAAIFPEFSLNSTCRPNICFGDRPVHCFDVRRMWHVLPAPGAGPRIDADQHIRYRLQQARRGGWNHRSI